MTTPTPTIGMINRDDAIGEIAATFTDRSAYLVLPPLGQTLAVAQILAELPEWSVYVDNGTPIVLRTSDLGPLVVTDAVTGALGDYGQHAAAVFTVPKTVPADLVGAALGQPDLTSDRDLISLTSDVGPTYAWPDLLVSALDIADPAAAAAIRATRDPVAGDMPPAARTMMEGFQARARRGEIGGCRHVADAGNAPAGTELWALWAPWAPGRVRCLDCHERAAERMRQDPAADHLCDGCGVDTRQRPGGIRPGNVTLTGIVLPRLADLRVTHVLAEFGLCRSCVQGAGQ